MSMDTCSTEKCMGVTLKIKFPSMHDEFEYVALKSLSRKKNHVEVRWSSRGES